MSRLTSIDRSSKEGILTEKTKNFTKGKVVREEKDIPKFDGATVDAELRALVPAQVPGPKFVGYGVTHN